MAHIVDFNIPTDINDFFGNESNEFIDQVKKKNIEAASLPIQCQHLKKAADAMSVNEFIDSIHLPIHILRTLDESTINVSIVKNCFSSLIIFLENISKQITDRLKSTGTICHSEDELFFFRNAVKISIYLVCELGTKLEKMCSNAEKESSAKQIGRKKKRASSSVSNDPLGGRWRTDRKESISKILLVFHADIDHLWKPPCVSNDIVSCVHSYCYILLDSLFVLHDTSFTDSIFDLLAIFILKYNHEESFCKQIMYKMANYDVESTRLGEGIGRMIEKHKLKRLFLQFIKQLATPENANDNAAKNMANFILACGQICYYYIPEFLDDFLEILEIDNYQLRSAVLTIIGIVINLLFSSEKMKRFKSGQFIDDDEKVFYHFLCQPDPSKKYMDCQDDLLKSLLDYIHDTNGYVRGKAINIWESIYGENNVSIDYIIPVVEKIAGRLYDKTSYVRKAAVNFLCMVIKDHPFKENILKRPKNEVLLELQSEIDQLIKDKNIMVEKNDEVNDELDNENMKRIAILESKIEFLNCNMKFVVAISMIFPRALLQLKAKQSTDRSVAVKFFAQCNSMGIIEAEKGVREIMPLIWSEEETVRKVVVDAFHIIFWGEEDREDTRRQSIEFVFKVSKLIESATFEEIDAISDIILILNLDDTCMKTIRQILWERFTKKLIPTSDEDSRAAIKILTMFAKNDNNIFTVANINTLITEGIEKRGINDFLLAKLTCECLLQMVPGHEISKPIKAKKHQKNKKILTEKRRWKNDDIIIVNVLELIKDGIFDTKQSKLNYNYMVESALRFIMEFSDNCIVAFNKLARDLLEILQKKTSYLELDDDNIETLLPNDDEKNVTIQNFVLSRFIFIIGHIALLSYAFLKTDVVDELRQRQNDRKKKKSEKFIKSMDTNSTTLNDSQNQEPEEDDDEIDRIDKICNDDLLMNTNTLGYFSNLVIQICENCYKNKSSNTEDLDIAAVGTLCKYMIVSSPFCEENLRLLFTLIKRSTNLNVRLICIISVGDLLFNRISELNDWVHYLYNMLSDENFEIRKATLSVLCRCFEYGIIKIKGSQLGKVALCLVDNVASIVDEAKSLFQIYAKRQEIIYNAIQDVITFLMNDLTVTEEQFQRIIEYLMQFLTKDTEHESFASKLCQKMKTAVNEKDWRQLAFCFTKLNPTSKVIQTLDRNIGNIADKLAEVTVGNHFKLVLHNAKKLGKASDEQINEFDDKIKRVLKGETFHSHINVEMESPLKKSPTRSKKLAGKSKKVIAKKTSKNAKKKSSVNFDDDFFQSDSD